MSTERRFSDRRNRKRITRAGQGSRKRALGAVAVRQVGNQQALLINAGALQGAIFNSARISIIATDEKGVIQIFNAGAELMFGYTAAEVMNKVMPADLYDLEDVNARGKALTAEFGKPVASGFEALAYRAALGLEDTYELKKVRKDGSRFPGAVTVTTLRDSANSVIGYLLIGTDNTERKRVEDQLRWTEEGFRLMVESVTDCAIVQLDPQGTVLSWNTGAQRIKGYSAEEIIGQNFSRFYPAVDVGKGMPQRDLDTTATRGRFEDEGWRVRKDGSAFWANSVYTAIRDPSGNLRGFAKLTRDLTERKQVEQDLNRARDEALQASRAKSEFLANMSHEIRTPMNGVIGMTEILQGTLLTPTQRDAVETIRFSGQALLTIINDILDFSKVEAGMLRLDIVDFGVHDVLERAIALIAEQAADKGLTLHMAVDAEVPAVLRGDPGRLHQVLTNLVANAVKFTEHGGIEVRAAIERESAADALVRFTVRDSGIGISQECQKRLFQPFMQADGTTTRKYGGSGLGLAISKQLAEVMGGEMGVESEPGKGSSFRFTARLEKSAAPVELVTSAPRIVPLEPRPVTAGSRVRRILVAEDNLVNQRVARHQLGQLGHAADVVDNGRLAVEAMRRKHYDVVLMDCQMPELDGFAATAEIRRSEGPGRHIWIIAMTAHAMGGDREKCLAAGMDDYLAKPVAKQALREALQRYEQHAAADTASTKGVVAAPAPGDSCASPAAGTPCATADASPINLGRLREAVNGDAGFARQLADLYLIQTAEQLELLRSALAERSASKVESVAHRCKGGSDACGAVALASLFQQLERESGRGHHEQVERLAGDVEREFARVREFFRDFSLEPATPGAQA
jgi:PAS domain S-box-containing protein